MTPFHDKTAVISHLRSKLARMLVHECVSGSAAASSDPIQIATSILLRPQRTSQIIALLEEGNSDHMAKLSTDEPIGFWVDKICDPLKEVA